MPTAAADPIAELVSELKGSGWTQPLDVLAGLAIRLTSRILKIEKQINTQDTRINELAKLAAKAQSRAKTHDAASVQRIETGIDVATGATVTYTPRRPRGRPVGSKDTRPRPPRAKLVAGTTLYHREDLAPE